MYEGRHSAITNVTCTCYYWACALALWQRVSFYQPTGSWFWNCPRNFARCLYVLTLLALQFQLLTIRYDDSKGALLHLNLRWSCLSFVDRLAQSVQRLATSWTVRDRISVGARFCAPVQTGPGAHPASCTMGTGSFLGVKSGRGVMLTPSSTVVKKG
jgi:hypothetical protein